MSELPPQRYAAKLRTLRQQAGLSQSELAERLGYTTATSVRRLEAGLRTPSVEVLLRTAHTFGVALEYLLLDAIAIDAFENYPVALPPLNPPASAHFGPNLRTLRTQRGLRPEDLAAQLSTTPLHIRNLEVGRKRVTPPLLLRLLVVFQVAAGDLFVPPAPPNSTDEAT